VALSVPEIDPSEIRTFSSKGTGVFQTSLPILEFDMPWSSLAPIPENHILGELLSPPDTSQQYEHGDILV